MSVFRSRDTRTTKESRMLTRIFLASAIFIGSLHSEAALLCSRAHIKPEVGSAEYMAERLDAINDIYNGKLFEKSFMETINQDHSSLPFFQRWRARKKTKELRTAIEGLKKSKDWDTHDFGQYAYKLEKLAFLADSSAINGMSRSDRNTYYQAQHSLLVHGLEKYLFDGQPPPPSIGKRVWNGITAPLHAKYSRWYMAMIWMPKLRGAALPPDLAMNVIMKGLDANREALKPYAMNANFKAYFNVFSSVYRGMVVAAAFTSVGYVANAYMTGQELAVDELKVIADDTEKMAKMKFGDWTSEREFQYLVEEFENNRGRKPTDEEMKDMRIYYESQKNGAAQSTTAAPTAAPEGNGTESVLSLGNVEFVQAGSAPESENKPKAPETATAEKAEEGLPTMEFVQAGSKESATTGENAGQGKEQQPTLPSIYLDESF